MNVAGVTCRLWCWLRWGRGAVAPGRAAAAGRGGGGRGPCIRRAMPNPTSRERLPAKTRNPKLKKKPCLESYRFSRTKARWCVAYPSWCPGLAGEPSPAGFGGGGGRYRLPPASAPPADCLGESESGECDSSSGSGSGDLRLCALAVRAALGLRAGGELELTDRNRRRRACRSDSVVASPAQQCQMSLQFFCCSVGTLSKPLCKPCRTEPELTAPKRAIVAHRRARAFRRQRSGASASAPAAAPPAPAQRPSHTPGRTPARLPANPARPRRRTARRWPAAPRAQAMRGCAGRRR